MSDDWERETPFAGAEGDPPIPAGPQVASGSRRQEAVEAVEAVTRAATQSPDSHSAAHRFLEARSRQVAPFLEPPPNISYKTKLRAAFVLLVIVVAVGKLASPTAQSEGIRSLVGMLGVLGWMGLLLPAAVLLDDFRPGTRTVVATGSGGGGCVARVLADP